MSSDKQTLPAIVLIVHQTKGLLLYKVYRRIGTQNKACCAVVCWIGPGGRCQWETVFRQVPRQLWDLLNERPFVWWTKEYNSRQILLDWICVGYVWWRLGELFDSWPVRKPTILQHCYTHLWAYTNPPTFTITNFSFWGSSFFTICRNHWYSTIVLYYVMIKITAFMYRLCIR